MQDKTIPLMDNKALYREESYTDLKTGIIKKLIPVKVDGSIDESREAKYIGNTQMLTASGPIPLNFELPNNLEKAVAEFSNQASQTMKNTIKEIEEMQRDAENSIIVPGENRGVEKKIQI